MSTNQRTGSGFEERLLQELQSVVVAQPASGGERPLPSPRRWNSFRSRRLALVGGVAVAVALAGAAGVPFLTGGAAPAYAVSKNDDGTVTIEVGSLSDAAGLESKLRAAGIPAVVQYLAPGKACKQPWFTPASAGAGKPAPGTEPRIQGGVQKTSDGRTRFTISRTLPADLTLVIMTQVGTQAGPSGPGEAIAVALAKGEVQPCEIVDAPAGAPPLGPVPDGGQVHTEGGPGVPGAGLGTAPDTR